MTEVYYRCLGYSSALTHFSEKPLAFKVQYVLLEQKWSGIWFWLFFFFFFVWPLPHCRTDDTAPTFISSGHNLSFQVQMLQLSFSCRKKSVLCIKGQDQVLSCELQEYKYFLAIKLSLSGVSSESTIVAPAVSDGNFPIPFWITGNSSLCKEHLYLLKSQFVSRCDYLRSVWEPCRNWALG